MRDHSHRLIALQQNDCNSERAEVDLGIEYPWVAAGTVTSRSCGPTVGSRPTAANSGRYGTVTSPTTENSAINMTR